MERLRVAVVNGELETARELLESGVDVNEALGEDYTCEGRHRMVHITWTPLHEAALYGDVPMARLLLEFGARTDVETSLGNTPLHVSVFETQSHSMVRLLLNHGSCLQKMNKDGYTTACVAYSSGKPKWGWMLEEHRKHEQIMALLCSSRVLPKEVLRDFLIPFIYTL